LHLALEWQGSVIVFAVKSVISAQRRIHNFQQNERKEIQFV
jgi:hypothetical protein